MYLFINSRDMTSAAAIARIKSMNEKNRFFLATAYYAIPKFKSQSVVQKKRNL